SSDLPKYNLVKKITYNGFKKLPRGILKDVNTGYGLTRVFNPILYFLEENFQIKEVIINNSGKSSLARNRNVIFSFSDLDRVYPVISNLLQNQKQDKNILISNVLSSIFPSRVKVTPRKYTKHSLYSIIEKYKDFSNEFSKEDIESISNLFSKVNNEVGFKERSIILKTKEKIEEIFIEDVIQVFQKNLMQKTETKYLERKWQSFIKLNNWILSQLFSYPVILHQDEAYVGGKNIENQGGKLTDFLIRNKLTNNVAFLEIKTHKSNLLKKGKPYRGNDVFPMSDDLSGAVTQVLDQRDNFQKEFYKLGYKSSGPIETFNSKCIVLVGSLSDLSPAEVKSFELLRSNSKDVEIITFDELFERIKLLYQLMTDKASF
ncbi:MAG TPA: hypothetical protein DIS94_06685, partial [Bacteroidetes bacterium]|nr:hypothetical protein [Bacteroidota bacterium]